MQAYASTSYMTRAVLDGIVPSVDGNDVDEAGILPEGEIVDRSQEVQCLLLLTYPILYCVVRLSEILHDFPLIVYFYFYYF